MSSPSTQHRRELGIARSRRPGTVLTAAGIALLLAAAFLLGRRGSDGDAPASAPVTTTTTTLDADGAPPLAAARATSVVVPDGYDGVAVTLPFAPGGGGYVAAGDRVDVHAVGAGAPIGGSRILLAQVLVLDVSAEVQARVTSGAAERPTTGQLTYLLAVPRDEVGALVAATQSETLYLSLLAESDAQEQSLPTFATGGEADG